jgi:hypothetical protein
MMPSTRNVSSTATCSWVATINNYGDDEETAAVVMARWQMVKYSCVGREVGEGGTPHLQAFYVFQVPVTRMQMERALGGRAFLEPMRGSIEANFKYCSKGGDVLAKKGDPGELPKSPWAQVLHDAKTLSPEDFQVQHPDQWLQRRGAVERVMLEEKARRALCWPGQLKRKNVWLRGEAGIGKSRWACELVPLYQQYKKNLNKWWDGFSPMSHTQVTIEDWDPDHQCLTAHLKVWADRYPFVAEVKGSSLSVEPGNYTLVVTSNYSIDACFREGDRDAIHRRFCELELTPENAPLIKSMRPTTV